MLSHKNLLVIWTIVYMAALLMMIIDLLNRNLQLISNHTANTLDLTLGLLITLISAYGIFQSFIGKTKEEQLKRDSRKLKR